MLCGKPSDRSLIENTHELPSDRFKPHPPSLNLMCISRGVSRIVTHLHLNIQNANPPLIGNVLHGLEARSVEVTPKLRVLDEPIFCNKILEFLFRDEVVLDTIALAGSWGACGVC